MHSLYVPFQMMFCCEFGMANRTLKGFLIVVPSGNMSGNIMLFGTFEVTMWTGKGFDVKMNCFNTFLSVGFFYKGVATLCTDIISFLCFVLDFFGRFRGAGIGLSLPSNSSWSRQT